MIAFLSSLALAFGATADDESRFYKIEPLTTPSNVLLEVSGITVLPDQRMMVCTRRGQVFIVEGANGDAPVFKLFVEGLQEPMGLLPKDGWIYVTQRGELSRMRDTNGDDRMDELETVCDGWKISGNYHEYDFGPVLDTAGNFWITLNRPFGDQPFGDQKWRGFAMQISPSGEMKPMCCGLRSPCGITAAPWGELFYTDNQGEWNGTNKLCQLIPGKFYGHPWGIKSCKDPLWTFADPGDPPNEVLVPEVAKQIPSYMQPVVWFPYDKLGRSECGFVFDETGGKFGPFEHQIFCGDQYQASVVRVFLEKVNGRWQGACFPFRLHFGCGIVRVGWGTNGQLFAGETERGWGSLGPKHSGLERVTWTGEMPFEIQEIHAASDGFDLKFTKAVDLASAAKIESYAAESYTYLLHETYGSDEVDKLKLEIASATPSADGMSVHLAIGNLRSGYVHELHAAGLRAASGEALLHDVGYYTLVEIPTAR